MPWIVTISEAMAAAMEVMMAADTGLGCQVEVCICGPLHGWQYRIRYSLEVLIGICSDSIVGPVTDYGSSMVQWMRHRQPRYKGGTIQEVERPSASYIVDVCSSNEKTYSMSSSLMCAMLVRCSHQWPGCTMLQTRYRQSIFILL